YEDKWPVLNFISAKRFIIFVACCLPLPYLLGTKLGVSGIMLQLAPPNPKLPNQLTLFSPVHIWEFLNSQLLASGTGFFVLLFILYKALIHQLKFDSILWF